MVGPTARTPSPLQLDFETAPDINGPAQGQQLRIQKQQQKAKMAPMPRQNLLAKEHFALVFGGLKTQSYFDPAARGPGSHT